MKTSSALTLSVLVTIVVSLLSVWFFPSIQDFMAGNTMWNGIKGFNDKFNAANYDTLDELPASPEKSVLVVIPYIEYSIDDLTHIKKFVNNGGMLLLMDDFGYGNMILESLELDVRFSNRPLLDPLFNYKNQWIPKITNFSDDLVESDITLILLNHATSLENPGMKVMALSSAASFSDINGNETKDDDEPAGPFSIAAEFTYGKGTVITVSDPSVLISAMIDRDDNYRFIEYLIHLKGEPQEIIIDRSHLSKTPLDNSKISLSGFREFMANPYTLTGVIALIFVVISRYTIRKGEAIG